MAFQLENTRPTWLDVCETGASHKHWLPQNHKAVNSLDSIHTANKIDTGIVFV